MTELEKFISNERKRLGLDAMLKGDILGDAVDILKDMHRPRASDVTAQDSNRVVQAAAKHDYQAGFHDCLRALKNLTVPKKEQTPETLQPFDDDWVREAMAKRGTPLRVATERAPEKREEPKPKTKSKTR